MPTLNEALRAFLRVERSPFTNRHYRRNLNRLITAIGPQRDVRRVTHDDLADYVDSLRGQPSISANTLQTYVRIMRTFFNWCVKEKYIAVSPAQALSVRSPGRRPGSRAVPSDDLRRMLDAARYRPRDRAVLLFLVDTACRAGGLASLTLDRLHLEEGKAVLLEKGNRWHTVYFSPETAEALRAWLEVRPEVGHGYVFTTTGSAGKPLSRVGVSDVVRRLSKLAGTDKVWTAHAVRHAVGHAYADAGVPVTVTQAKLGHSSPDITMRFYYPEGEQIVAETSRRLPLAPLRRPAVDGDKIIRLADFA